MGEVVVELMGCYFCNYKVKCQCSKCGKVICWKNHFADCANNGWSNRRIDEVPSVQVHVTHIHLPEAVSTPCPGCLLLWFLSPSTKLSLPRPSPCHLFLHQVKHKEASRVEVRNALAHLQKSRKSNPHLTQAHVVPRHQGRFKFRRCVYLYNY